MPNQQQAYFVPRSQTSCNMPLNYLAGLDTSNDTGDVVNDIDITSGGARNDTDTIDLLLSATNIKQLDVTFAEYVAIGTPSGGRDATDTLVGAKWFNVFLIGGTGKNTQGFFSTSLAPALPSGFQYKRRIGAIRWSGATIVPFAQLNNEFLWVTPILDVDLLLAGAAARLHTLTIPSLFKVLALFNLHFQGGATAGLNFITVESPDNLDSPLSAIAYPMITLMPFPALGVRSFNQILRAVNAQIRSRNFDTGERLRIATTGWIDYRDRL